MAFKKVNHKNKIKRRVLTKRDKANKRVALIKKVLEKKKREKHDRKKKVVSYKKKINQEAEDQVIELTDPKPEEIDEGTQNQMNILNILGLGESKSNQTFDWEKELEKKLKEVNEKSIDNPEVRRVYGEIGKIFGTYRSGKVPKAFKIIPNLEKWNEVLQITHPESWTPQAMFQAVNIFASNFDPVRAEEFYKNYLVPAIKKDLSKSKKLNYHYFQSLKKALYKTNAWFKGILFEFCSPDILLREIKVIESLLTKMSIPVISSSVAMIKMMEMPVSSAVIHYLLALLNKSYSFPKKVLQNLTNYMLSFESSEEQMPVIWHQLFLALAKQYGNCIDEMSKGALASLAKNKHHKLISPEIISCLG